MNKKNVKRESERDKYKLKKIFKWSLQDSLKRILKFTTTAQQQKVQH